jgi:2-methylcitrate dehydratase PrpD
MASLIAKHGGKAASTAFEGKTGFLSSFAGNIECAQRITDQLGQKWEIMNAAFKPFPICALNQTPVIKMLNMIQTRGITSDQIEWIRIRVNPHEYSYPGIDHRGPFFSLGTALMSTSFCLALACIDQDVTLQGISKYDNPKVINLIERIQHIPDPEIPRLSCIIELKVKGKKRFYEKMFVSADYYNFDMEQDVRLIEKVTREAGADPLKVRRLISIVKNFDKAKDAEELIDVLAKCP